MFVFDQVTVLHWQQTKCTCLVDLRMKVKTPRTTYQGMYASINTASFCRLLKTS